MNTVQEQDYKAMSILSTAMIAGIALFSFISIAVHFFKGEFWPDKSIGNTLFAIALFLGVIVITVSNMWYKKKIDELKEANQTTIEKLNEFRSITITHAALCEFLAILSIIFFLLTGSFLLFLLVGMALVEMVKKFPTRDRIDSVVYANTF